MTARVPERALSVIIASYLKRWISMNVYDPMFAEHSPVAKPLKGLGKASKHGIEVGLYALMALFDTKMRDDTTLKRIIRDVGTDFGSEMSKRLLNNAREMIKSTVADENEGSAVQTLLDLPDEDLHTLLDTLYSIPDDIRSALVKQIADMSSQQLEKLTRLSPEQLERLIHLEQQPDLETERLRAFNDRLERWIQEQRDRRS